MSLFEMNLGGRQAVFNGSGITTNANYPLTEGEALSTNNKVGLIVDNQEGLRGGGTLEFYGLVGDKVVGRVFGEELPWDYFQREDGKVVPRRFSPDLYNVWVEQSNAPFAYKVKAGTLNPDELPEMSRKETNYVKLGSLLWRAPITNNSYFEKDDRKLEQGRHPIKGADAILDYEWADEKHLHLEVFAGKSRATPQTDLSREVWGGRAGADLLSGNLGFSLIKTQGERPGIAGEHQTLWAVDGSHPLVRDWSIFGVFAKTYYTRGQELDDNAIVAGLKGKALLESDLKLQYQRVEENYELMNHHKVEHYPSNYQGFNGEWIVPVKQVKFKSVLYQLWQLDTNTTLEDTIWGDSFLPPIPGSERGWINVARVGFEWPLPIFKAKLNSYVEHVIFRKEGDIDTDIDKDVTSIYSWLIVPVTEHLNFEFAFRHFIATGGFQEMDFHHRQDIPEVALSYAVGKDRRATLMYHHYTFVDSVSASTGLNNYDAHQVLFEFLILI
jgi:hypothetical protein